MALVGLACGFQPEMTPFNVAKMNRAGSFEATWKPVPPLNTIPVAVAWPAGCTVTTSGWFVGKGSPEPSKTRDTPPIVLLIHHGLVAERATPQALKRCGSVNNAKPGRSETRLVR